MLQEATTDFDIRLTVLVGYYGKLWRSYLEFTAAGDFTKGKTLTTAPGGSRTCTTKTKKNIFSDLEVCQLKSGKSRIHLATPQAGTRTKTEKYFGANINDFLDNNVYQLKIQNT